MVNLKRWNIYRFLIYRQVCQLSSRGNLFSCCFFARRGEGSKRDEIEYNWTTSDRISAISSAVIGRSYRPVTFHSAVAFRSTIVSLLVPFFPDGDSDGSRLFEKKSAETSRNATHIRILGYFGYLVSGKSKGEKLFRRYSHARGCNIHRS